MADMPGDFWAGWIAVLTVASLMGLGWLIYGVYFTATRPDEEGGGPVWDDTLREGSHPAPMWWFWLILALLVLSVVYLMLYPGLGSYAGALRWSQSGELETRLVEFETKFGAARRQIAEAPLATLQADAGHMASAERIYSRNCAACHGDAATGQAGHFPDLTDAEWQWGGSAAQIEQSIRGGRLAVMVGWLPVLGEEGVQQVAEYTQSLAGEPAEDHPGRESYVRFCVACHAMDGTGNPLLGAPSLVDDVTLYGNDIEAIRHSVAVGRSGQMPAFGDRLDDTQIRLLVALLAPREPARP